MISISVMTDKGTTHVWHMPLLVFPPTHTTVKLQAFMLVDKSPQTQAVM